jgi:4-amino-4-deoxy-L-arabinose transferase-like glycosyltransferase
MEGDGIKSSGVNYKRHILLFTLVVAFGLRLFLVFYPEVIRNDGIEYIRYARQILAGDWTGGKAPPLYPLLIAFFHFFSPNDELAGIWVSVVMGTLIVLPIFYLGKEIFNEKVGMLSALLAAVHPFLYPSSGSVLTESTYYLLLTTAILFGWKAFHQGKFYPSILFSLFTTLAYLTRPEAIALLLIHSAWVLGIHPPQEKRSWRARVGIVLLTVLGFLVFASPYLIKIRMETGKWGISQKISISIGSFQEEEGVPSIDEIRRRREFPLVSLLKDPLHAFAKMGRGIFASIYKFQQGFHPFLFLLAILGFIFILKKKSLLSLKGTFYLLSYLVFYFGFVLPFFWVTRRYTSQMISIALPWAGFGLLMAVQWVDQRWKGTVSKIQLMPLMIVLILIGLAVHGKMIHGRDYRFIQRETGLWMKENVSKEGKIMSSWPQEAFYAERPWIHMPSKGYDVILKEARSQGVRYLVTDEKIEEDSPGFLGKINKEDLLFVKDLKRNHRSMTVFEVVYP